MFENWDLFAWVTVVLAFLAIIVPSVLWFLDRRRQAKRDEESRKEKRLGYRIDYAQSLVSLNRNVDAGDIEVLFKGRKLVKPEIMGVTFENIGQIPIAKRDFSESLKLVFSEGAEIVSVDVEDKKPDDLPIAYRVNGREIEIEDLLLNAGDSFSLKVLGTKVSRFDVSARIVGVLELEDINKALEAERRKELERVKRSGIWRELVTYLLALILLVVVAAIIASSPDFPDSGGFVAGLAVVGGFFAVGALLDTLRKMGLLWIRSEN